MIRQILVINLALILNLIGFGICLNTYQFKIFPVGTHNNTIVTIDFQIRRTSETAGKRYLKLKINDGEEWNQMWFINAYLSEYDKNQNLISKTHLEENHSIGNYLDTLQLMYIRGYNKVLKQHPSIKLLNPIDISFCDFQQSCKDIILKNDSIKQTNTLTYKGKSYPIEKLKDTSYYAFNNSPYHDKNIMDYYVSSIRVYKNDDIKLVLTHLANGHETSMDWITNDPKIVAEKEAKNEPVILANEHKPDFKFNNLKETIYEEPLLHHGYGFDVFFTKAR